ncbi:2'-5' RNA ligase family protein [Halobellus salinisoli]|uniref:2'-5' RNA ligase family protein n=1 Tax=Halobellus salinisoli TaxID=3108500 RepID=UPI003009E5C2
MFSLNVPVPGGLKRVAAELHPELSRFERIRERHTLVAKRFDTALDDDADSLPRLRERLRPLLRQHGATQRRGSGGIDLRVTGLDYFETPTRGAGPVVFLAVESDDLQALHRRLCESFGTVSGIEGDDYVPHVTLARGGRVDDADNLVGRTSIDPIEWTATELHVWDSRYREAAARIPLR